jgi:hypothetical protein
MDVQINQSALLTSNLHNQSSQDNGDKSHGCGQGDVFFKRNAAYRNADHCKNRNVYTKQP